MEHKIISRGEISFLDSIPWKKGFTGIFQKNNQILFAYIWKVRKPETKGLDEIRGLVSADYQNYLEEKWIQSLKTNTKLW
jgi:peptidyl-prolyl cis-trans isomerase SurA